MADIESKTVAAKDLAALKADMAKTKVTWDLHVLVIMRQVGLNKGLAAALAYTEGEAGLNKRLAVNPVVNL